MSTGIGFISEAQIEEKKKARQEEWERVRKPEEPLEAPVEEPFDGRSLYDRLQEQKNIKQEEFEESKRLKNLVKVLDDDECEFLDYVDQARIDEDRRKRNEEARELFEFRNAVAQLREKHLETSIHKEIALGPTKRSSVSESDDQLPSIGVKRTSQSKLLAGLVVKRKHLSSSGDADSVEKKFKEDGPTIPTAPEVSTMTAEKSKSPITISPSATAASAGLLPGLASYGSSSDSEGSE